MFSKETKMKAQKILSALLAAVMLLSVCVTGIAAAENQIEDPEQIKAFERLGYRFDPTRSNDNLFVFILNATGD